MKKMRGCRRKRGQEIQKNLSNLWPKAVGKAGVGDRKNLGSQEPKDLMRSWNPCCHLHAGPRENLNKQTNSEQERVGYPRSWLWGIRKEWCVRVCCVCALELAVSNPIPTRESHLHPGSSKLFLRKVNSTTASKTDCCLGQRRQDGRWSCKAWDESRMQAWSIVYRNNIIKLGVI